MDHKLISCDDHLDMNQLPADLWTSRMPAEFRDRAPHVEESAGPGRVDLRRPELGPLVGQGHDVQRAQADLHGLRPRRDRRSDRAPARRSPSSAEGHGPRRRHTHVVFGPVTSFNHPDMALPDACYRVYNDWLADFCAVAPDRLLGVPMLPPDPESALKELKRIAGRASSSRRTCRSPWPSRACTTSAGSRCGRRWRTPA